MGMENSPGNFRNSTAARPASPRASASTPLIQPLPKARSSAPDSRSARSAFRTLPILRIPLLARNRPVREPCHSPELLTETKGVSGLCDQDLANRAAAMEQAMPASRKTTPAHDSDPRYPAATIAPPSAPPTA